MKKITMTSEVREQLFTFHINEYHGHNQSTLEEKRTKNGFLSPAQDPDVLVMIAVVSH